MTQLTWDGAGNRLYETGVDRGVLYLPDASGNYTTGFAWNGLTTVTESPSGAESNPQYADNLKYLNLLSAEDFGATVEAFTYPDAFAKCDGTALQNGVSVGQQSRLPFGLAYRTLLGNDLLGRDYGYKLHLVYGAQASPSEKAYATVNDSPEAIGFSWECTTSPVAIGTVGGQFFKPAASLSIDSTKVNVAALETILYGSAGVDPRLPLPAEVLGLFLSAPTAATAVAPAYNSSTHVVTVATTTGIDYRINGVIVTTPQTITGNTVVTATPKTGFYLAANTVDRFGVTY